MNLMTKLQLPFDLSEPLDDASWNRLADVYKIYGILRICADPAGRKLTVEYDATRFSPNQVAAILAQAGIPLAKSAVE